MRLNYKRLGYTVLAMIVVGGTVHFLHAYQTQRNASAFLLQADRAAKEGDVPQALQYLERYLSYVPGDTDALVRYAELLVSEQAPQNSQVRQRALDVMEQVLRRDPSRAEVRRRLVLLALSTKQFSLAREHLEVLMKASPQDSELEFDAGRCEEGDRQYERAVHWYQQAITHAKDKTSAHVIASYARQAEILRRHLDRGKEATQLVETLIKLAPERPDVLLIRAELAGTAKNVEEARKHLDRGIELYPQDQRFYLALAKVEMQQGQPKRARTVLAKALESIKHPPTAWLVAVTDLLLDAGDPARARNAVALLEKGPVSPGVLDYFQGRLLLAEEQWLPASRKLENARPLLARTPELVKRADLSLALCYERLGNKELEITACRRALVVDPVWLPARLALAQGLAASGQYDEALDQYQKLVAHAPALHIALARLQLARALGLPASERRWPVVMEAIDQAKKVAPESLEPTLLEAQALTMQAKTTEAGKLLEVARAQHPKDLAPWLALATLADQQGDSARSQALLVDAQAKLGDAVDLRLAQARLLHGTGPETVKAITELEKNTEAFPKSDRIRLELGLAQTYFQAGAEEQAKRLWLLVAEQQAMELPVRLRLFELALRRSDEAGTRRWIDEIRKIEGEEGTLWRWCEAARLTELAAKADKEKNLEQAERYLGEVAKKRPTWHLALLLGAQIQEQRGNFDRALESYLEAIKAGERQLEVMRRTALMLYERRRFREAEDVIRGLPEQTPLTGDLGRLAADLALRNQDRQRALDVAKQVCAKSTKYQDYIWLGQMYAVAGQRAEAEASLRAALQMAEKASAPWVALVLFLSETGQKEEAERVIQQAQEKLPAADVPLTRAECYEAIGRLDQAEKDYETALKARPDDPETARASARFFLQTGQTRVLT